MAASFQNPTDSKDQRHDKDGVPFEEPLETPAAYTIPLKGGQVPAVMPSQTDENSRECIEQPSSQGGDLPTEDPHTPTESIKVSKISGTLMLGLQNSWFPLAVWTLIGILCAPLVWYNGVDVKTILGNPTNILPVIAVMIVALSIISLFSLILSANSSFVRQQILKQMKGSAKGILLMIIGYYSFFISYIFVQAWFTPEYLFNSRNKAEFLGFYVLSSAMLYLLEAAFPDRSPS